jgi:hypothetical protein
VCAEAGGNLYDLIVGTDQDEGRLVLWRAGGYSDKNFTPRPGNDTQNFPFNGLSVYATTSALKRDLPDTKKGQKLDRAAVAAIPGLVIQLDPAKPGHYFLRADTIYHHLQWAQTRDAEGTHYLTQALMMPPVYLGFERI